MKEIELDNLNMMFPKLVCLMLGALLWCGEVFAEKNVAVVFIGNSITYGVQHKDHAKTAPPVVVSHLLEKKCKAHVYWANCGISGATTYDFLPSKNVYFPLVEKAVKQIQSKISDPIIFSIMLGTNDSACSGTHGAPVSNEDYKKNLLILIERLREMAPNALFVLHRPIWYSPNTYNGAMYLKKGLERLIGYHPVLKEIVEENKDVLMGDECAYGFFEKNYRKFCCAEEGNAGVFYLHPNEKGAIKLANFWCDAILRAIALQ